MFKFIKRREEALDFNKEIFMGEIGALFGIQIFSYIFSRASSSLDGISLSAVFGATIFSFIFFLSTRIYNSKKRDTLSVRKTINEMSYYIPGSFILVVLIYYPSLFFISRFLLYNNVGVSLAVFLSQLVAFIYFLISINIYRLYLKKFKGLVL